MSDSDETYVELLNGKKLWVQKEPATFAELFRHGGTLKVEAILRSEDSPDWKETIFIPCSSVLWFY